MAGAATPRLTGDTVTEVSSVSIRDLRNHGGEVIDRVERGESVTVTRDGRAVARLIPLPRERVSSAVLSRRWQALPPMDPEELRSDVDAVIDPRV